MDLGSRIKAARLEAGLSQRQLCADHMTRNMLSQIENGSARPSMKTLAYLAQRLEKPVSYFLEEQTVTSPNRQCMLDARAALALGDLEGLREALDAFREPDPLFIEEWRLLDALCDLRRGEWALEQGYTPYGVTLLRRALDRDGLYITRELRRRCRVLLGLAGEEERLEADEDALLVRAAQAGTPRRALEILSASEDRESPKWNLLQAHALFDLGRYEEAAACYRKAPQTQEVFGKLEICYRELGDYKLAYEYACKQR